MKICFALLFALWGTVCFQAEAIASMPLGAPKKAAGGKRDMFGCMQSNDYYIANFSAYQFDPQKVKNTKFMPEAECIDLPLTGQTLISVDMLDRDVRHKEVYLRILRSDGQKIAETPKTVAKQGVVTVQTDFKAPGKYELQVLVIDMELNTPPDISALIIPLSVALPTEISPPKGGLAIFFVLIGMLVTGIAIVLPKLLKSRVAS